MALKGTRLARRMVSRRDVAVTICEDPAVREVKIQRAGSVEKVVAVNCAMTVCSGSSRRGDVRELDELQGRACEKGKKRREQLLGS